jgi:hypothetical protein
MRASKGVPPVNKNRRTTNSARRRAMLETLKDELATPPAAEKPIVDSITTRATPCPSDPPDTEETLP